MYECNIIEVEDFGFNHYIHHIDEDEFCDYNEEIDLIECDENIIWD